MPHTHYAEQTKMHDEAKCASDIVSRQVEHNRAIIDNIVTHIRAYAPRAVVTCARGSSDHACTYGKYLIETHTGLLVSSAAPSVSSVYAARQSLEGVLFIAISQSGKSPDLLATVKTAKEAGALVLALVNVEDSPLATLADLVLPLRAGLEVSIAATKSYIATLSALLHLVAEWQENKILRFAISTLPFQLSKAWEMDWSAAKNQLAEANNLFVIGRGTSFGIAQEAALKFKETSGLHAEAFSAAEVRHGPMALIGKNFPLLIFSQEDETQEDITALIHDFTSRDAIVMTVGAGLPEKIKGIKLPMPLGVHPATEAILFIQAFYRMVNELSVKRGFNPDKPPYLNKVTETV